MKQISDMIPQGENVMLLLIMVYLKLSVPYFFSESLFYPRTMYSDKAKVVNKNMLSSTELPH